MNVRKSLPLLVALAGLVAGWHYGGWAGVAFAVSGAVMYVLIHLSRMLQVLRRAANHPKGHVGRAVMLNAKLKAGVNLLHVIALTGSIGDALTPEGQQPEVFRWTDDTESSVTCEFVDGRLARWSLSRPGEETPAP